MRDVREMFLDDGKSSWMPKRSLEVDERCTPPFLRHLHQRLLFARLSSNEWEMKGKKVILVSQPILRKVNKT
ncbi:hypothetical protein CEXT_433481 [Caerostris extrusa]|uniref:Uncharacterized protein n=1 Tax=Caerostris extrusa TaxID=172846 RepID=A0AAV4MDF2_CAEEX|nr:hypothetical protein CEXT_433481 [Caerostris extrusa]